MTLRDRLGRTPPGYDYTVGRVLSIYLGLMIVLLLAALDQTIVGPVLPTIVTQLNGADLYTWVVTIFLLTSTVTVPIYGKLSDLYGRRPLLLFGISLFLVGSFLSGLSQTMWQLILFRGIQGLGAGALFPIALATIGDLFSPAERGKYQGLFGAVFGIAFLVGPALGGFLTDHLSWHWIFFVNIPIGLVALVVITITMPRKMERSDCGSAGLPRHGGAPAGARRAGHDYAWGSGHVVGAFAGGAPARPVRGRRASRARADPAVRSPAQPDRRRQRRLHGARRDEHVRDHHLRPGCSFRG